MKTFPFVLAAMLAAMASVRSQDAPAADSPESNVTPAAPLTTARILGNIPDGTPPPPSPPKPEFIVLQKDILQITTHEHGGRTITVQRIKPIALPPPPPTVEQLSPSAHNAFSERSAEYRQEHYKSGMFFLSATVFRFKDSPPRTLVRYSPEGTCETITFWSSADFALIAGGIQSFVDSAGDTQYPFMGWSNVEIDHITDLQGPQGRLYGAPDLPDFDEGKAGFQIIGTQPGSEALVPIQSLHDLYNSEHDRLKTAYEGREQARIKREAYLNAHPPQPKDLTLNYWRTEKPTPVIKGGAK